MNESTGKLLSPQERAACDQIASGETSHSQHAQALLALDEGGTQAQAAERSGLTPGQVKYWSGRFRAIRLGIFPPVMPDQSLPESVPASIETLAKEAGSDIPVPQPEAETKKKAKKGKKAKIAQKSKKDKQKAKKKKSKKK